MERYGLFVVLNSLGHCKVNVFILSCFDTVATEQLAQEMESVSIKTEGDLANLDFRARIAVAMLLDPKRDGGDWRYIIGISFICFLFFQLQS